MYKISMTSTKVLALEVAREALSFTSHFTRAKVVDYTIELIRENDNRLTTLSPEPVIYRKDFKIAYRLAYSPQENDVVEVEIFISIKSEKDYLTWVPVMVEVCSSGQIIGFRVEMDEDAIHQWNPDWKIVLV